MPNPYFRFKQFTIYHDCSAMKVTTDGCLFGAWCAAELQKENKEINKVLDIGTGTGLLSLMIAQKNEVLIDAVEIDEAAATQAKENIAATPWNNAINVFEKDITTFKEVNTYDAIISNPPFYESEIESANAKKNLAHHGHGLTMQQLANIISRLLSDDGLFFLLLPYKRFARIEKILHSTGLYTEKKVIVRPSPTHPPFRLLLKGRKQKVIEEVSVLSIRNEQQQYTTEFIELLHDYYLYL